MGRTVVIAELPRKQRPEPRAHSASAAMTTNAKEARSQVNDEAVSLIGDANEANRGPFHPGQARGGLRSRKSSFRSLLRSSPVRFSIWRRDAYGFTLRPSWVMIPISSELPQRSISLPLRNFAISTPRAEIRWPVAAMP